MSEETSQVEEQTNSGIETLPDETQKYIKSLRKEAAENRVKANEFRSKLEEMSDYEQLKQEKLKQAEENGQFKELYEKVAAELEQKKPLESELQTYREYLEGKLDSLLADVDETTADLIKSSTKSISEKLTAAEKLSLSQGVASSKGADRPGGQSNKSEAEYLTKFESATPMERIQILNDAKNVSKELHARLIALVNN